MIKDRGSDASRPSELLGAEDSREEVEAVENPDVSAEPKSDEDPYKVQNFVGNPAVDEIKLNRAGVSAKLTKSGSFQLLEKAQNGGSSTVSSILMKKKDSISGAAASSS